jgi:dephospho-CoA kinase
MTVLVGLTGGLAGGKSTVAAMLRDAGCRVIDADRLVAELYRPGGAGTAAVAELFGPEMLAADGSVDRGRLGERVFADPAARRRLERAVHPLVRARFGEIAAEHEAEAGGGGAGGIVVLEGTLLVEAGFADDFDLVVTVEADPEARIARAAARGMDEAEARRRLAAQGDGAVRRARADRVIANDGTIEELRAEVDELLAELGERAGSPPPPVDGG